MTNLISSLLVGSLCAVGGVTLVSQQITSKKDVVTRSLALPAAESLDIGGFADVTISEGSPQQIVVTGPAYLLDQSELLVQQGVLRFRPASGAAQWLRNRLAKRLKIGITMPALRKVFLAGSSTITGLTPLTAPRLALVLAGTGYATLRVHNTYTSIFLNGAGTVTLCGTTTAQGVRIQGAGTYHGFDLTSLNTAASISGVGTEEVRATDSLSARISGIGVIRYRGQPVTISRWVSGLGKLEESQ